MSITVVIPAYNAERFLGETLESALAQTLPPSEIIVVDDGSADNTARIAKRFGPPVRVIRRTNQGQAKSRNQAVEVASSPWVAFLDADDLWEPHKLARQMEEIERTPRASLCYTARLPMLEHGGTKRFLPIEAVPSSARIREALYRNTVFLPSSVLVHRETFLALGGFDPSYRIVEDWDLWLRFLHAGEVFAACPEPLLLYRVHPGSISNHALLALKEKDEIFRQRVLPKLPAFAGWFRCNRVLSEHRTNAAYILRDQGDASALRMMASSVARDPFHDLHRYKVLAHMIGASLRLTRRSGA